MIEHRENRRSNQVIAVNNVAIAVVIIMYDIIIVRPHVRGSHQSSEFRLGRLGRINIRASKESTGSAEKNIGRLCVDTVNLVSIV